MRSEVAVSTSVNTVLGPVSAEDLGVVAVHEALLSVCPGARARLRHHDRPRRDLRSPRGEADRFREAGGGTVVDSTGMFHGRDVPLFEALSRRPACTSWPRPAWGPRSSRGLLPHSADEPADPVAGGEVRRPLRPGGHRGHGRAPGRAARRRRAGRHRCDPRGHDAHGREPVPRRRPRRAGHRRPGVDPLRRRRRRRPRGRARTRDCPPTASSSAASTVRRRDGRRQVAGAARTSRSTTSAATTTAHVSDGDRVALVAELVGRATPTASCCRATRSAWPVRPRPRPALRPRARAFVPLLAAHGVDDRRHPARPGRQPARPAHASARAEGRRRMTCRA